MNCGFSMVFFAVWPGGRRCANCRDARFFERYCDESIFTWKTCKTTMEKTKKQIRPMGKVWGEAWQGTWVWIFCFVWFFHCFLQFGQNLEEKKKKKKFRPMGKVWVIHTQTKKQKKTKNQKTKKPKNQKNKKTKKTKKNKIAHPKGRGSDAECWVLSFCFFVFFGFLVFCFFGLCVDSHCRCAKQRLPGTVSGCTRSKVDTLQYSNVCYDIVHSANEEQRGMEFNFVRLRHMLLDLCTGNAAICALPWWPVLYFFGYAYRITCTNTNPLFVCIYPNCIFTHPLCHRRLPSGCFQSPSQSQRCWFTTW